MADVKISELSEATSLADSDVLAGVNSGTTRKFTLARLKTFFLTGLSKSDVGLSNVANERQYSSNNPQPADKTTISTATATTMSGILQGTGSAVTALPFDSSTIANDATHVPSSAAVKSAIDNLYNMEIGVEHETPEIFLGKRVYCKALSVTGSYPPHPSGDVQVLAAGLSQGASIIRAGASAKHGTRNVYTTPYASETTNVHFYAYGFTYNNSGNAWQARVLIVNDTAFSDLVVWAYYTKG